MAEPDDECSETEIYYDAFDKDGLDFVLQLPEKDILSVARNIGHEWKIIGVTLGYKSATLNHLEEVYPQQPQWRNFMLIQQWCDVVSHLHLNARQILAHLLYDASHTNIADSLCTDYKSVVVPEEIFMKVEHISFDKPVTKCLERYGSNSSTYFLYARDLSVILF